MCIEKNIVKKQNMKAACKRAILGGHDWIVSFDINSLYHILLYNIIYRFEKIVGESSHGINVNKMLDMKVLNYLKTEIALFNT